MNRYDYQKELAKAAGGTLVATTATAIAAVVVVDPDLFEPIAHIGIAIALGGLLVGDLAIRAVTPDPFEQARERYDEARDEYEQYRYADLEPHIGEIEVSDNKE